MRKRVILAVILIFLISGVGFAFQNEPDGFRELKWGDPPAEDMVYWHEYKGTMTYKRPTDKMGIGSAKFYSLGYSFYGQQFYQIMALFENEDNYNVLKTICEERFGEPTAEKYYDLCWWGEKATIFLDYDSFEEKGGLSFYGREIMDKKIEADKQKELEEAEEDF